MNITIMKIARIEITELTDEAQKYIEENFTSAWSDPHGGEDIYDINGQLEEISHATPIPLDIRKELDEVQKLVNDNECSGFMITI